MIYKARKEYAQALRERYQKASKIEKTIILNEFCLTAGFSRKYAIRLLNGKSSIRSRKSGPKRRYGKDLVTHIRALWIVSGKICSTKPKAAIPELLPYYLVTLDEATSESLLQISRASIDRPLKEERKKHGKSTTSPAKFFKTQIPVRLRDWNIDRPGYFEADTVSHCGDNASGPFMSTLTLVDIGTQWTACRALWGKNAHGMVNKLEDIRKDLEFSILGFRSDNGSEFLNSLVKDFMEKEAIEFVRTRPYRKNDNCKVEQKNFTHVRRVFGYERIDQKELLILMNLIYKQIWDPLQNFFIPKMKLLHKERIGSKIKKHYDEAKTPYQRIIECSKVSDEVKEMLTLRKQNINPFSLRQQLDLSLKTFFSELRKVKQMEDAA
jgi:hypothetical protein